MTREMDDLFGGFWERSGYQPSRKVSGFVPRVDVYYCGGGEVSERAVVKVELPGVDVDAVHLEVRGRSLTISGEKPVRETEGRTYQQVELPSGQFRRVVELSVDVEADRAEATYEDGILQIELPVKLPDAGRQVPIQRAE